SALFDRLYGSGAFAVWQPPPPAETPAQPDFMIITQREPAPNGHDAGDPPPDEAEPADHANGQPDEAPGGVIISGIALTPYSYERLDNLRGYESGMPNPGFYHHMWLQEGEANRHRRLLSMVTAMLRERNQVVSSADLIAVETMAQALAALRGHRQVWRRDLIDGIISALVKDELAYDVGHPFLEAIHEVFRGDERGKLDDATTLPPLVADIKETLKRCDIEPPRTRNRYIGIDLSTKDGLAQSRVLHQLRVLGIPGFRQMDGTNLNVADGELIEEVREAWELTWSPEFEAACVEASIYGPTLVDAAQAKLVETADLLGKAERADAAAAAKVLLDAALMGLPGSATEFYEKLLDLIHQDSNFFTVTRALGLLLFLYRFDKLLGTAQHADVGELLRTTFQRGLWLLESLGAVQGQDKDLLGGVRALLQTFERCASILNTDRDDFLAVFERISHDNAQTPVLRGAVAGVLFMMGSADGDAVIADMRYFADPAHLGDYLNGLFALAREVIQRQPDLAHSIDTVLADYGDEDFLTALPSLRLAFTPFTPREKHAIARVLFEEQDDVTLLQALGTNAEQAAQVLAFETALFQALARYGVNLDDDQ
ncbi:MAG: hypothetical protein GYB67_17820, partial [Chloroflexi bacterium]|nr:hypothetical protein [Chloroflexota bacterium]